MEQRLYDAAAKLPATDAKLDTSLMTGKTRYTNGIGRIAITLAACAAAIFVILFGAVSLAGEVREYNVAASYFAEHGFSTEGLSRRDIKDVYKDIVNGTFTHPKTESVLNSIRSTEPQPTGDTEYEQLRGQYFDEQRTHRPTEEEVLQVKERMYMKEVVELIGKPHNFGPTSGLLTLQWELADGQLFVVYVSIPNGLPDDMEFLTQIFEYGYIYNPGIWKWASPDPTAPTDPTNPTDPEAEMLAQYFDLEKTHRPTFDEVLSIQEGTPVSEVVDLIGKPHGFATGLHGWAFWWETIEGYACIIDLNLTRIFPIPSETVEDFFKYCVVYQVMPLVEMDAPQDSTSNAYDEAGIYNAVKKYFTQREAYLLGKASTIDNVHPGIVTDEDAHKAAIAAAGIEWLSSDIVIHAVAYWDSHAEATATEIVTYRENGVEKTEVIVHRLQLGQVDDGRIFTVGDHYYESITGFKSCSYIAPPYQTPQPNLTEPYDPNNPTDPTDPTDPSEPVEPTDPEPIEPGPTEPCAHVWGQWIVVAEATCDRAGQQERSCDYCDEKQTQEIPKQEHEESDWIIDKPADVGVEGHKHTECIRCHRQMREETIPAITQDHQHSSTTWSISTYPGCTTSGTMQRVCSCGEVMESKPIDPVGHDHVLTAEKKATCTENGSLTYACTRCSNSYTTKINATGHVFGDWQTIREPSNGQDGEARRTCKNCTFYETKTLKDESKVAGGTWGTMTWAVFTDGRLVITGSGAMPDGNTEGHEAWKFVLPDWCEYNQQITTVLLDDRITVIGDSNFYSLFKVTSVHLPASLQEIRNKAFSSCGLGEGITFPDTLTTIGNRAFEYYKGTALTLPASCTSIGEQAFAFAPNLETADLPGVTSFGQYAFAQCKALERVNLCPKLQQIPTGLFKDCWMLNELSIPDSVQSIGDSAFLNCFSLRRLTFGTNSKLASIGENALPYGLTTFTIPKNVTSIGTGNFTHAWEVLNLSSATVPFSPTSEHAQLITSAASSRVIEENGFVFFTTAEGEGVLIGCNVDAAQITIPSHYTYQSRKVTVIGIADYAIRGCLRTEKVVLSSTLQFVADYGLFFCPKLENCVWLSSQKSLDQLDFDWNKWTWSSTNVPQKQVINVLNTDGREFYYIKAQGTCGTEAIYKLYGKRSDLNSSVLSIEGSGAVTDTLHREFNSTANVKYVVINPGITELGNSCLTQFLSAEFVYTGTQEQWEQVKKGYNWGIGQEPLQFIPDFFL